MSHEEITKIRLHGWKKRLAEHKATPQLMIGVAIEGPKTGEVVVLCTEDIPVSHLKTLLTHALLNL